jgi:hypothetical protein
VTDPTSPGDWKQHHADESEKAVMHPLVQGVIAEQRRNLGIQEGTLRDLALFKVATYAAQVARAQALGFDPELLRLTAEEANEQMLDMAARASEMGVPVWVIEQHEDPGA